MSEFRIALPEDVVEAIVATVVERVRDELGERPRWLTRAQAAEYLGIPVSRLEKDKRVPCRRWDGRVLYDRLELDRFAESLERAS